MICTLHQRFRPNGLHTAVTTALLAVSCTFSAGTALAQERASARSDTVLEEIVVTARKTEEAAQDLPITITAYSGVELDNKVVLNVQDLQNVVAGLNVSTNNQAGAPIFSIRGNATQNLIDGGVVVYFDEVPVQSTLVVAKSFYDIASVEILKGPQGTQFGTNTTGGTISVRAKKPTDEFEGFIEAGYGDYDRRELKGMINLPVNDMLKFRFAGNRVKRDGYVKNPIHGGVKPKRYDSDNYYSFRASMRMEDDNWTSDIVYDYYHQDDQKVPNIPVLYTPTNIPGTSPAELGERLGEPGKIFIGPNVSGLEKGSYLREELWGVQHVLNVEFNDTFSLRNVVGYRDDFDNASENNGGTSLYLIEVLTRKWRQQWTEDLTLRFNLLDDRLRLDVGGFYRDSKYEQGVVANAVQNIFLVLAGAPLTSNIRQYEWHKFESKSVYANVDYDLSDRTTVFAGYRYNWDSGSLRFSAAQGLGLPDVGDDFFPDAANPCSATSLAGYEDKDLEACVGRRGDKWSEPSWTVGANYQLAEDKLVYAKVSHGYIAGGLHTNIREFSSFDPETTLQYEVGLKADWELGGRPMRSNIAVYYSEIDDKQIVQNTNYDDGGSANGVFNAAKEEIKGADLELQYSPVAGLTLEARYSYVDAKFKEFVFPTIGGNGDQMTGSTLLLGRDLSGESPAEVPDQQFTFGLNYLFPTDPSLGDISLSITGYYTDDIQVRNIDNTGEYGDRYITLASYWRSNASLSWDQILGSSFSARFWIQNIFDEEIENSRDAQFATFGYATVRYGAPRIYGVSLRYTH